MGLQANINTESQVWQVHICLPSCFATCVCASALHVVVVEKRRKCRIVDGFGAPSGRRKVRYGVVDAMMFVLRLFVVQWLVGGTRLDVGEVNAAESSGMLRLLLSLEGVGL